MSSNGSGAASTASRPAIASRSTRRCPAARATSAAAVTINLCDNRMVLGVSCGDYRRHGAFAEYVAVPARILYKLPDTCRSSAPRSSKRCRSPCTPSVGARPAPDDTGRRRFAG